MTWERFFLLAIISAPIMATSWLLWVVLPPGFAYAIGVVFAAVIAWYVRPVHDEALRQSAIRSGRWPI